MVCALVYSDSYQGYELSPSHPMKPARLMLTYELMRAYGFFDGGVAVIEPRPATEDELALVHDRDYIAKVRELSQPGAPAGAGAGWGLDTGDNPIFPRMHEASALIAGASITAAAWVMEESPGHAFNMAGGLHHALSNKASGFCVYNDAAIAIAWLKKHYGARVLYLDFDAHHGDGVQYAFEADPDVLTVSFHESGMYLFPGTGFTNERGRGAGSGYAVNLPLPPGSADGELIEAFDALVPPLARAFRPDIIVTQDGCDAHWSDPLSHLALTLAGYRALFERQHRLAHELTGGRWLALGGGGYQAYTAVPRIWTILLEVMAGRKLDDTLPEEWRRLCARFEAGAVPRRLNEDGSPEAPVAESERVRASVRRSVDEIISGVPAELRAAL
ncbi:MAG: acetoin utilization protein AcuC [Thermoleophilia bacterium]